MTDTAPPLVKRRRVGEIPVFYYALGSEIVAIENLDPARDLPHFRGALVPDFNGDSVPGTTEEHAFWVPPCLWQPLLEAPNITVEFARYNMILGDTLATCRDGHIITLIYDLRAAMNTTAGDYWTAFYDQIVDSICDSRLPSNDYLPFPEGIVSIARYLKTGGQGSERAAIQKLYPDLHTNNMRQSFPLWALRDITTARGGHKKFLTRVLRLFPWLREGPPQEKEWCADVDPQTFASWLAIYWKWRDFVYVPTEEGIYGSIANNINNRHAILHKNTRDLFKRTYLPGVAFTFQYHYAYSFKPITFVLVDPLTAEIIDLATCEGVWRDDLINYFASATSYEDFDPKIAQHAIRQTRSASITTFSRDPYFVHPIWTLLLNPNPVELCHSAMPATDFEHIAGVPREELYWKNLEPLFQYNIGIRFRICSRVPENILVPDKPYAQLDPRLLRVLLNQSTNYCGRLLFNHITPGPIPLTRDLDSALRANGSGSRYSINKGNRIHWQFLVNTGAISLFPEEVKRVANRLVRT